MKDYREKQKALTSGKTSCKTNSKTNVSSIDKDIEREEDKKKRVVFTPPTLEQVVEYCRERNNSVDAQRFIDYYTANGWMVGRNKMKDWKASVRTWERSQVSSKTTKFDERQYTREELDSKIVDPLAELLEG